MSARFLFIDLKTLMTQQNTDLSVLTPLSYSAGHKQSSLLHHKMQLSLIAGDLGAVLETITNHLATADLSERR